MLDSLYTAISGLDAQQQMLDITSNNIANSNTVGFKSSAAEFEDAMSQTLTNGSAPSASSGGTDATQVGLGVRLASTEQDFAQGSPQSTGVPSNLMINGNGFFEVSRGAQTYYTRAGNFTPDSNGSLVLPDGAQLMGYAVTSTDTGGTVTTTTSPSVAPINLSALSGNSVYGQPFVSYSIDTSGNITGVDSAGNSQVLAQVALAKVPNTGGLLQVGDNEWSASPSAGAITTSQANSAGLGNLSSGYIEMSNTDLAGELTNLIIAERGFQADSKVVSTSDQVLQTLVSMTQ